MKDMSIIANKKIINKETNEVRLVVSIDEENRKIHPWTSLTLSRVSWLLQAMTVAGSSTKSLRLRSARPLSQKSTTTSP